MARKFDFTKFKTGDLLLCHSDRLLGKLISKATKSHWTHTANFIWINDLPFIIEAQREGVRPISFTNWIEKYNYEFEVRRLKGLNRLTAWSSKAMSASGSKGYDFISFISRHPWHLITNKWRKRPNEYKRMICSEFTAWTYGYHFAFKMTPKDVAEATNNIDWKKIEVENV